MNPMEKEGALSLYMKDEIKDYVHHDLLNFFRWVIKIRNYFDETC